MGSFPLHIWGSERAGTEAKLLSFSQRGTVGRVVLNQKLLPGDPPRGLGASYHSRGPAKQSWLMPYLLRCSPALSQQPFQLNLARHGPAGQEGIAASTEVWGGGEVPTVPPHQIPRGSCQQVQGTDTLAESHQCCLRCCCTHPPLLGTNLVPGEGREECQEALCHQLFPLHLAVEVLGFVPAAEEEAVPCRSRAPGLCWEHPGLGTAGATWLTAPA